MASVALTDVTVIKGGAAVLDGASLEIRDGELFGVVGPSGAGKTSLLRVIAGLDPPDSGTIFFDDTDVTQTAPGRRDVAMVFQDATLMPHLSARGNVGFPLKIRQTDRDELEVRVQAETRALHIEHLLQRSIDTLSVGERHLVQIARSLVRAPQVFLMDEPLRKLDAHMRTRMRYEFLQLQRGYGVTMVYATNDPPEAMEMADRMAVMSQGRIAQIGTPAELYQRPASRSVAEITGSINLLEVVVKRSTEGFSVTGDGFSERAWAPRLAEYEGLTMHLGIRPDDVVLGHQSGAAAVVESVASFGGHVMLRCRLGDAAVQVRSDILHKIGETVHLGLGAHTLFDSTGATVASALP